MLDISLESDLHLYRDPYACLQYLRDLPKDHTFKWPENRVNFHVYSEMKTEKELLCVQSYLATQDWWHTKLILWSDTDISDNPLIQPYKEHIELRVYDAREEAKGTVLENNDKWINSDISDRNHYMKSGIFRFLITHKYGGIWADMDMVFLRNFKPILDQEWAYTWGAELDFKGFGPCAAMMNIHKDSEHSRICMEEILTTENVPDSTVLDHILLAKVYNRVPFTVFPTTFFNTEWSLNTIYHRDEKHYDPEGAGTVIQKGWFEKTSYSDTLFDGAFAWHWHNSSSKDLVIEPGSKFHNLQRRTHSLLQERGIGC